MRKKGPSKLSREYDDIINDLALRYNKPRPVIEAIVASQFEKAKKELQKRKNDPYNAPVVMFQSFGRLIPKKQRIERINEQVRHGRSRDNMDQEMLDHTMWIDQILEEQRLDRERYEEEHMDP